MGRRFNPCSRLQAFGRRVNRSQSVSRNHTTKKFMPQDNMIKFECKECRKVNYHSKKNKKTLKTRLELKKFCKSCRTRTDHKETK